jgi:hypothetical protein
VNEGPDSERFMARVEALLTHEVARVQGAASPAQDALSQARSESVPLSPLGAGIVVAVEMGLADSRGFARALGVEHALVLREVALLSGPDGLIIVTGRHPKTLRTSLALSARGAQLLNECCGSPGQDGVAA